MTVVTWGFVSPFLLTWGYGDYSIAPDPIPPVSNEINGIVGSTVGMGLVSSAHSTMGFEVY